MSYHATVYSAPGCQRCRITSLQLQKMGVETTTVQISDHPDKAADMRARGELTLPLVEVTGDDGERFRWTDMRKDNLDALKALVNS
ncbi:glutaredoxin domain-containing protein [Corynebacterium sp. USCH3]|uniref:glutaredoxin family protein n=1 Tax=Corynebacterium sp. USCH3 TaxID=3024840 RepID=UPI0030B5E0E8